MELGVLFFFQSLFCPRKPGYWGRAKCQAQRSLSSRQQSGDALVPWPCRALWPPKAPRTGGCGNPSTLWAETFSWFRWLHISKCCAAPRLPLLYSEVTVQRSRARAHLSLMPAAAGSAALFHVLTQSAHGVAPINLPEASSEFRAAAPSEHTNSPASSPAPRRAPFYGQEEAITIS